MNEGKSNKGIIVALVIFIVVLIAAGVAGAIYLINQNQTQESGIKTEPNVFFDDQSAEEFRKTRVPAINVTMIRSVSTRKTQDGKVMAVVGLENKNDFQYKVNFTLADTGELIAETGLVPAGAKLDEVELLKNLEPGTYSMNASFYAISPEDNKTSLGSTGINVDLNVK